MNREKFTPAVSGPKILLPVIIGNQGKISENFLYDPATGDLVHTVAMQRKGGEAIRRSLAGIGLQLKLRRAALSVRLFVLRAVNRVING